MYEEKLQSSESSILKTDPERLCALSIVGIEYHCKKVSTFGAFREQKPWKENDDTIVWARDSARGTASRSHTASEHHQQSDSSRLSASRAEEKGVKVNESENVVDLAIRVREEPASAANMTESRGALSEIHAHSSSEPALDNDIEARLDASSPAGTRSRSDSIGSSSGWKTPLDVASKPTILANDPVSAF
ncbi:hypothetical protein BT96DRAFT_662816 [Gymnopus androsaceus JB14]|uniref:Uncharacterized protein n=1 Tax=Gymnopus androsaceus JB14 TaxID=1447944 RepID=A0A6A4IIW2_9AGAR|nr:hypothetical protein BT96DRAFT_662816 [Gymnopus androsaceus JB14]